MLSFNSVLLFSDNPARLVEFYSQVLESSPMWSGGNFAGFRAGNGYLTIGPHSEISGSAKEPQRIMLNFETDDVEAEFQRITALGAAVIAEPYHPDEDEPGMIATLSDPDGNYFQLVTPFEMMV